MAAKKLPRAARERPSATELLGAARAAAGRAYSPYSRIEVGAALLGASGALYTGCNVENASYGLTQCAERAAVTAAVAAGERSFRALAIWASTERPLLPCGACRQVLAEFASDLPIHCACARGPARKLALARLLPLAIGPADIAPARAARSSTRG